MTTLRTRIIISTMFIIFLIITGSYLVIQDLQRGIIEGDFRDKGNIMANHLALEFKNPLLVNDLMGIRSYIDNLESSNPDIEYVFLTDSHGNVMIHTFEKGFPKELLNLSNPSNVGKEEVLNTEMGVIHDFDAPLFENKGYVHVGISENRIREQILDASRRLLLLAGVAMILGGIFTYFIGRRLTEPVLKLTEGAKKINKGILDQKIDIKTGDELGELASTFNDMASSLNQKMKDLVASKEQTEMAQKYLETLFDSIEDGIIVLNINHEIIKMNSSFLKMMGLTEDKAIGRTCHEIILGSNPAQSKKELCSINTLLETKKPIRFVQEVLVGDNKIILELTASLFLDGRGTSNIILVLRDVTQQKALEEENIVFNKNIKYLKEFNEEILNNVNLAIHVVDKDMNILAVNDELIRLGKGRIKKELVINKNLFEAFPFLKERHLDMEYEHVLKTGEIFLSEEKTQYFDDVIYTDTSKIPIKDKNGNVEKIITVITDVTERKKLEEELKDSYEELKLTYSKLQELFRMKNNFLSNISHELRTPLTSVIGYTELMLEGNLTDEQRHKAEIILRNSKRLSKLISALLDTPLIESGTLALKIQLVSLFDLAVQVIEDMKSVASIKNIPIFNDIPEFIIINGDKERLLEVFSNILDNAIKFTIKGEIRISAEEEAENIHVKVIDTGIGIPQENLLRIFDKFYLVESSNTRKYEGAGLGLWISKNIVEAHGGRIWAESKNRGSTFHILLPKSVKE
ncbi:MAG: ATP-binding protein [Candidatus Methanoperedens sp.]|nr:ATP-binding protein [Candidatus Methanoperedens sp.]